MLSVILAGGKGLRLWPESRQKRPKQLCEFFNNRSMLNHTIDRLIRSGSTEIMIVSSEDLREELEKRIKHYPAQISIDILSEPEGKNTAPAVGLILARLYENNKEGIMGIFPADHYVGNEKAFSKSLEKAIQAAREEHLVTIGIMPQSPETGYGYIEKTRWEVGQIEDVFEVSAFREKPDLKQAETYLESGNHLWNAGIYVGHSNTFLEEFALHLPEVHQHILKGFDEYISSYASLPNVSLDYGIAEKSKRMAVVPSEFNWCDLGHWNAMADFYPSDSDDNVVAAGDSVFIESHGCLVRQRNKPLVLFGVENLLVVECEDLVFIADRSRSQDLRQVTETLQAKKRLDLL